MLTFGETAALHLHHQNLGAGVVAAAGEAILLRATAVPGVGCHLLQTVPVAQGDVIAEALRQLLKRELVGAGLKRIKRSKTLNRAVGQNDPGPIR